MKNLATVRMYKKMEVNLEIYRVEQEEESWEKRIYIRNLSDEDMVWGEGYIVNDFYIQTSDLLDLSGCGYNEIYDTKTDYAHDLYDNEVISTLFDEFDNNFMDNLQIVLLHYLINNNIPPYFLCEEMYEGDIEPVFDSIQDGEVKGVMDAIAYDHPIMKVNWEYKDKIFYLNNPILNMEFEIEDDTEDREFEYSYNAFAKRFNELIMGHYDWSKGNYSKLCDRIQENIYKILKLKGEKRNDI